VPDRGTTLTAELPCEQTADPRATQSQY